MILKKKLFGALLCVSPLFSVTLYGSEKGQGPVAQKSDPVSVLRDSCIERNSHGQTGHIPVDLECRGEHMTVSWDDLKKAVEFKVANIIEATASTEKTGDRFSVSSVFNRGGSQLAQCSVGQKTNHKLNGSVAVTFNPVVEEGENAGKTDCTQLTFENMRNHCVKAVEDHFESFPEDFTPEPAGVVDPCFYK